MNEIAGLTRISFLDVETSLGIAKIWIQNQPKTRCTQSEHLVLDTPQFVRLQYLWYSHDSNGLQDTWYDLTWRSTVYILLNQIFLITNRYINDMVDIKILCAHIPMPLLRHIQIQIHGLLIPFGGYTPWLIMSLEMKPHFVIRCVVGVPLSPLTKPVYGGGVGLVADHSTTQVFNSELFFS